MTTDDHEGKESSEVCLSESENRSDMTHDQMEHILVSIHNTPDASPIACLATELLLLIFEHGHEGRFTSFSHLVSSVCTYWRTVAISAPSLWSPIVFEEGSGNEHYLDLARLYLERSQSYPINIIVGYGTDVFIKAFRDELIMPHLHRCRSLTIEGDGDSLLGDIIHLGSAATPLLENLELISTFPLFDAENLGAWLQPPHQPIFDAPNLRIIRLDMIPLNFAQATRYFRLENVTSFWFRWNPDEAGSDAHNHVTHSIETMAKLRELTLICTSSEVEPSPLPLLTKLPPTLTSLELSGISISWDILHANWPVRDFSSLQMLRFTSAAGEQPTDTDFFTLLALTPQLRELNIGAISLLAHPQGAVTPVRLPQLARLTLEYCGQRTIQVFSEHLTAPALIKATFIVPPQPDGGPDSDGPDPVIPPFWSSCLLVEHITLSHGCTLGNNGDLLAALRVLKHVKSLDLRGRSNWGDALLSGLGTEPWPCPSLETVSFSYIFNFTQEALESFVLARRRGRVAGECAAIKKVGMRGCQHLKNTETLEKLVDEVWHWI